tara:strand:+ start:70 stop:480 length:411 start_codon:yes stop_codon:yes gene_type:complete
MGFIKLNDAATGQLINCDNVMEVKAAISNSGVGASAVASVDILYAVAISDTTSDGGGVDSLLKTAVSYSAPGANNSYSITAADLQKAYQDAIVSMSGSTGDAVAFNFEVGVEVTSGGAKLANAVPTITIKKGSDLT